MRIRVYHAMYGCDSGCCGHVVDVEGTINEFKFDHPNGDVKDGRWIQETPAAFARRVTEDVLSEYAPRCLETIDWNSIEWDYDDVRDD
jgi:hypothetical protein